MKITACRAALVGVALATVVGGFAPSPAGANPEEGRAGCATPPPVLETPPSATDAVAVDMHQRRGLGLRAERDHAERVRAERSNPASGVRERNGLPVTADEHALLERRAEQRGRSKAVSRDYLATRADVNADVHYDHASGELVVNVVADPNAVERDLRSRGLRDPFRVQRVPHARAALDAAQQQVRDADEELLTEGVTVLSRSVSVQYNCLSVSVEGDVSAARGALERHVDGGLLHVFQAVPTVAATGRPAVALAPKTGATGTVSPPLRGGSPLTQDLRGDCTSGFVGYRNTVPTTYYELWAAHCTTVGGTIRQATQFIGHTDRRDWPGESRTAIADAARMPIPATYRSNQIFLTQTSLYNINSAQGVAGDMEGDESCHVGHRYYQISGVYACGVIREASYDYCLTDRPGLRTCFIYGRLTNGIVYGGDSGGSVFSGEVGNLAVGIVSGAQNAQTFEGDTRGNLIYGHIYDVMRTLDVHGLYRP